MSMPAPLNTKLASRDTILSESSDKSEIMTLDRKDDWKILKFDEVDINPEELINGFSAEDIFNGSDCAGITFDDLIALPGSIDFGVHEVVLKTKVTKNYDFWVQTVNMKSKQTVKTMR